MSEREISHEILPAALSGAGLNLTAVFPLDTLPSGMRDKLTAAGHDLSHYTQLILIAHAGTDFWRSLQEAALHTDHPVDTFTRQTVTHTFDHALQGRRYAILYPGPLSFDLQALGALAGWHHASPFWVGINPQYGTWYAYRALILADSHFVPTTPIFTASPCDACETKPCIQACPAQAMHNGRFDIDRCVGYRRQADSACRYQCLARNACPVGREHRYDVAQMQHHYAASLKFIEAHYHR